jgi:hypothetical protein
MTKKQVREAILEVWHITEHGPMPKLEYCSGHDDAVLQIAARLGLDRKDVLSHEDGK